MRDRGEELSEGGILRDPLAVAATVDDHDAEMGEFVAACLFGEMADGAERGAAAADADAVFVRNDGEFRAGREETGGLPFVQLGLEGGGLLIIGGRQNNIVPADEIRIGERPFVIVPSILVRLR